MKLEFYVRYKRLERLGDLPLVGDTGGHYTFTVDFDAEWDGLAKVVVFQNGEHTAQVLYNGETQVPAQVCGRGALYVACHGYRRLGDTAAVVRTLRMSRPLLLHGSEPMAGDEAQPYTPTLFEQVVAAAGEANEAAAAAREAAERIPAGDWEDPSQAVEEALRMAKESGEFDGPAGPQGPKGDPGSDATVTKESIDAALGYTPAKTSDIPTQLPNPNALTINGQSYDGSKPVEVEVKGSAGIHVGPEPPDDPDATFYIDTDEDPPEAGSGMDVTAEVGQTIVVEEVDASGKPVKWRAADYQPRTHWMEWVEVVPEQTLAFVEDAGGYMTETDLVFAADETYRVTLDGVTYDREPVEMVIDGVAIGVYGIGNTLALGGEDTGEPFFAACMEGFLQVVMLEPTPEITISISVPQLHKIPEQYLHGGIHWIDAVEVDGALEQITVTPAQTDAAIKAGLDVKLRIHSTNSGNAHTEILPCVTTTTIEENGALYQLVFNGKTGAFIPTEETIRLTINTNSGSDDITEILNMPWVVQSND